ncbi:MAG: Ig-like domain-containing protein [Acidobacteria bacterium]|nr:Ig-like domain-containing protein [Acidobacteriota bacterium]
MSIPNRAPRRWWALLVASVVVAGAVGWSGGLAHAVPPFIKSYSPAMGSTGAPLDTNIVLTMSEAVSLEEGTMLLVLFESPNVVVERIRVSDRTKVTVRSNIVTIDPSVPLAYDTLYSLLIPAMAFRNPGLEGSAAVDSPGTIVFRTVSLPESNSTTTTTAAPAAGPAANTPCTRRGATRIVGGTKLTCRRVTVWRQG